MGFRTERADRLCGRVRGDHLRPSRSHVARARAHRRGGESMKRLADHREAVPRASPARGLETAFIHLLLIAAVAYALYPVLWVVSLALSPRGGDEAHALPIPREVTLAN